MPTDWNSYADTVIFTAFTFLCVLLSDCPCLLHLFFVLSSGMMGFNFHSAYHFLSRYHWLTTTSRSHPLSLHFLCHFTYNSYPLVCVKCIFSYITPLFLSRDFIITLSLQHQDFPVSIVCMETVD